MKVFRRLVLFPALIVALVLAGLPYPFSTLHLTAQSAGDIPAALTVLNLAPAGLSAAPQLSALELQAIRDRILQIHNRMAAQERQASDGPGGIPRVAGPETVVRRTGSVTPPAAPQAPAVRSLPGAASGLLTQSFVGVENQIDFGRDHRDPFASDTGGCGAPSDVAELVGASNGLAAFAAGNCSHVEASQTGGATWDPNLVTPGPPPTTTVCCDHDVIYDDSTRVVFHTDLYTNGSGTQTAIGIDVYRFMWNQSMPSCTYFIGPFAGMLDFPHVGLTKSALFISINFVTGPTTQSAVMLRYPKTAVANCTAGVTAQQFLWPSTNDGQRVWVPSKGTNNKHTMLWAHRIDNYTLRIFKWDDSLSAPNNFIRPISFTSSAAPDATHCGGGLNNTGYITATQTSLVGFNFVGAVTDDKVYFYWQAGPAAAPMTLPHIDGAVFGLQGTADVPFLYSQTPLAQPHIYSTAYCIGYPAVTANKLGDIGMVLAFGGKAGGGGLPVRPAVGVSDEFSPGTGQFGPSDLAAVPSSLDSSTGAERNPAADDRYGDYLSTQPEEPCEKFFVGTGYFIDITGAVNQRVFEFGRHKNRRCYDDFATFFGTTE